ncbi:50S ribosomal protein L3 [Rickettsiales endosymbiont of Peranema trichophorum]|uniref:50S ribosomal protein L3 n=1 Tax=Rickettsiales endosymbiont of Peranema trichophorum TaxID=2486577 RepID=UPI001023D8E5|nr:50S ribosomal protein L3 [Rickettsiales endosymbiont of Peranema trichophorum]RZI45559.1 50S ribosomal protein L3 [Rickettsiales endosymbiont of Peranema trichophorum]
MSISRRTGLVATKLGMSQVFDELGNVVPVTLLHVARNVVLRNKKVDTDGYDAVVIGYGRSKPNRVSKPVKGMFAKLQVEPTCAVKEFRVSADAFLEVGKELSVSHFVPGQFVDVMGTTIGKGFAGPMKRHNFSGLEASHGVSVSHRSHGSTGQRQDPGKVFKNKKMAGHMGNVKVSLQNLRVVDVDSELSVIALHGAVPGSKGSVVYIADAVKSLVLPHVPFPGAYLDAELSGKMGEI